MATNIFKVFETDDEANVPVESTTGLWTNDTGSLTAFHASTTQLGKANSKYFIDIYNSDPATTSSAEVQFSIAYGHVSGAGSPTLNQSDTSTTATKAVYLQLKNTLLDDPTDALFAFENSTTSEDVYAISVSRARFKGVVDPGNWQLSLSGSSGKFTFIDNSLQGLGTRRQFARSGTSFSIATGSISGVSGSTIAGLTASNGEGYGTFFPAKGILVLNPSAIEDTVGFLPRTGSVGVIPAGGENTGSATAFNTTANSVLTPLKVYTASLSGTGGVYSDQFNWHGLFRSMVLGADFQARASETISSKHYFVRLRNNEYNSSNNPTFSDSSGNIFNEDFEYDPKVYVTTIGLYNDGNECLAVAKLSRPLEKSRAKEALLRVRLDF
jgi:hypothetical protein